MAKKLPNIYHDEKRDRWQGKLTLPSGKRQSVYGKTQREVQTKLAQLRREVEAGMHGTTDGEQTFLAFAQSWYNLHRTLGPKTLSNYRSMLRHHFDGIGHLPLTKLTPVAIQQHYAKKLAIRSSTTVHHLHGFFHVVLENAVKLGILPRNPADHVDAPPLDVEEFQALSEEQVQTLIAALRDDPYEAAYVVALSTGLREAELLGLTWEDIDWNRRLIRMGQTLKLIDGVYSLHKTKNPHSRRTIPLPDYAASVLMRWRARQAEERDLMGTAWGEDFGLVFTTPAGRPVHRDSLLRHFRAVLHRVGLPEGTRIHDLRHTFATLLLERGVHVKVVSELLGHSNIEITLRVYGHVTPRMQGTAVTEINALLPAPGVAEAVAGEIEAEQQSHSDIWARLQAAIADAMHYVRSCEGLTFDEERVFGEVNAAWDELFYLVTLPEDDVTDDDEDIGTEEPEGDEA